MTGLLVVFIDIWNKRGGNGYGIVGRGIPLKSMASSGMTFMTGNLHSPVNFPSECPDGPLLSLINFLMKLFFRLGKLQVGTVLDADLC